jgi:hypothetical protein
MNRAGPRQRPAWWWAEAAAIEPLKLLVIARREPREGPVNSSGSSLEAHPDCLPADANCCHSLLLDPIGYTPCDLHDWLFLLVIGGEK